MKSILGIREKRKNRNSVASSMLVHTEHERREKPPSKLLQLPGELRNKIYSFAIFPQLDELFIANCTRPRDIARSILKAGIYRVSRQMRAEAISWLLSNKRLIFFGVTTANALFESIGPERVQDVLSFRLIVTARYDMLDPYAGRFFSSLESVKALRRLEVEVGVIAFHGKGETREPQVRKEWEFLVKIAEFVERKRREFEEGANEVGMKFGFEWCMWSVHELGVFMHDKQREALRGLFGAETESEEPKGI